MTFSNLRWLGRQLRSHYTTALDGSYEQCMEIGISYDLLMARDYDEPMPIMPNAIGIKLMARIDYLFITPYWIVRQHFCRHPRWVNDSYAGPDHGCDAGHCPDCHFSFHHTMY